MRPYPSALPTTVLDVSVEGIEAETERVSLALAPWPFLFTNFHASQDGHRAIDYAQRESEDHYWTMRANPEAQVHVDQAATIAIYVQSRLFTVAQYTCDGLP